MPQLRVNRVGMGHDPFDLSSQLSAVFLAQAADGHLDGVLALPKRAATSACDRVLCSPGRNIFNSWNK